jgi:hypothetical protein
VTLPNALVARLTGDGTQPSPASGRESDPVAERLVMLTRPLRPGRSEADGSVVLHDGSGRPFAAAWDGRILVRLIAPAAALDPRPVPGLPGWSAVDPHPADIGFARGTDVLRDALVRAHAAG